MLDPRKIVLQVGDKVRPKSGTKTRQITEVSTQLNADGTRMFPHLFKWGGHQPWHSFYPEWVLMPADAPIDHSITQ